MSKKTIIWIASYPKSGNTWMRLLLANYFVGAAKPLPINQVHRVVMFDAAVELYRSAGITDIDAMDQAGLMRRRGDMLRWVSRNGADVNFVKTHAPAGQVGGIMMIPPAVTRSSVYILRNPLDVVLSYARHFKRTPAESVEALSRSSTIIAPNPKTASQPIGNWSEHVTGWAKAGALKPLLVRYEDMLSEPMAAFSRVLAHIGVPVDKARLERAIGFASFDELQRQEAATGFREQAEMGGRFFHTGQAEQWRDALAPELVDRVRAAHGATMARYGYDA